MLRSDEELLKGLTFDLEFGESYSEMSGDRYL
jgi:hypothetical protein